jgi:hypothetical protein
MRIPFLPFVQATLLALLYANPAHAQSLGSGFSYQGQLKEAGLAANGLYDFQACLYANMTATTSLVCVPDIADVPVSAGLFTMVLDFGATSFVGQQRLLELRVRPGASTGSYTPLAPRQALRATPEALRANLANTAPWSGLFNVPVGFADNTDNDSGGTVTSISAGAGLSGGTITGTGALAIATGGVTSAMIAPGAIGSAQVNPAQVQTRIAGSCGMGEYFRGVNADGSLNCELLPVSFDRVLESGGDVGSSVSIALRSDGRPVIAHHNNSLGFLRFFSCLDAACLTGTNRTLDGAGADVGEDTSVAIRPNGLPVIAYRDVAAQALKLYDCTTDNCSAGVARVLDATVNVAGRNNAMVLRADGRPFIAYFELSGSTLRAYDCANVSCSTGVVRILTAGTSFASGIAVQIRADGRPLIALGGNAGSPVRVRLYDCVDIDCTSATGRTPPSGAFAGPVALVIRSDGRPLIATSGSTNDLGVSDCADAICSSNVQTTLTTGLTSNTIDMQLRSNGFPLIAYGDLLGAGQSDLRLFDCANTACSAGSIRTVVGNGDFGSDIALALRADGRPVIAYYDALNDDLRLRVCANPECI